jgi:glucan phosphoethanolaminetransferase (alkaline phosphatase superfamily)
MQVPQSIFLFLAAALMGSNTLLPFGSATADQAIFADGVLTVSDNISLMVLPITAAVLAFIAIFMHSIKYKKSLYMWQRRLSLFAAILAATTIATAAYFLFASNASQPSVGVSLFTPVVAMILIFLSTRATNRDEALIKSSNRIRD